MIASDIPPGTTVASFIENVLPALHARYVSDDAPTDAFAVVLRIEHAGSWTVQIRGRAMTVSSGEIERPTLWLCTNARTVERFLQDAAGERRFLPKFQPAGGPVVVSDPRLVKRVALAHGRAELALRDVGAERLAVVFGFGQAARRRIDPDDADVVIEAGIATLELVLTGRLSPQDALTDGTVDVRGNRMIALQLALAVAPFAAAAPPR